MVARQTVWVGRADRRARHPPHVGVLEDLRQAAGHGHHFKYFLRTVIECTMTGPSSVSMDPSSIRRAERLHGLPTYVATHVGATEVAESG